MSLSQASSTGHVWREMSSRPSGTLNSSEKPPGDRWLPPLRASQFI